MRIMLVGCGGYAAAAQGLLQQQQAGQVDFVGIIYPYAAQSRGIWRYLPGFPCTTPWRHFGGQQADLTIVSTPIALHHAGAPEKRQPPAAGKAHDCRGQAGRLFRRHRRQAKAGHQFSAVLRSCHAAPERGDRRRIWASPWRCVRWCSGSATASMPVRGWAGKGRWRTAPRERHPRSTTAHYLLNMLWLTTPGFLHGPRFPARRSEHFTPQSLRYLRGKVCCPPAATRCLSIPRGGRCRNKA